MIKQRSGRRYLAAAIVVASVMVLSAVMRVDGVWRVFEFLIPLLICAGAGIQGGIAIRCFRGLFTEQRSRYSHRVALAAAFMVSAVCLMGPIWFAWMLVELMLVGVLVVPLGF